MSPARTAPSVNVVAAEFRLTEKLVTSRSGLPVPTKLGSMSPTGSDTVADANAGEATSAEIRTAESLKVFIEKPLLVPPLRRGWLLQSSMVQKNLGEVREPRLTATETGRR